MCVRAHMCICTSMKAFNAALSVIAPNWKHPNVHQHENCIGKFWCIHIRGYCLAIKGWTRNSAAAWINFNMNTLSKISQPRPLVCKTKRKEKKKKWVHLKIHWYDVPEKAYPGSSRKCQNNRGKMRKVRVDDDWRGRGTMDVCEWQECLDWGMDDIVVQICEPIHRCSYLRCVCVWHSIQMIPR